jgi:outer membrane lipoprotein SlyB
LEIKMGTTTRMHALRAIGAVSATLFSLAGIGAIACLIPAGNSQAAEQSATLVKGEAPLTLAQTAPPPDYVPPPGNAPPPGYGAPPGYAPPPTGNGPPPGYAPPPGAEPPRPFCRNCGVIESVREVEKKNAGVGSGTVIGGIAGGVLGNQIGRGNGRSAMTVLGAIGGAVAGHEIEKNTNKPKSYEIVVRFEDGSTQLITQDAPPPWRSGDRVRVVDGIISARNHR